MENEKIINRMIRELEQAKANPESLRKHIENVQLLGSLFLENDKTEVTPTTSISMSEKEKEVIFGDLYNKPKEEKKQQRYLEDDGANGDSIFDF